jgi:hypothetical protein
MWPWAVAAVVLVLFALLFIRNRRNDMAALRDTAAVAADTTSRYGRRAAGTAGGAVVPRTDTATAQRAGAGRAADTATLRPDTATRRGSRADTAAPRADTTTKR